MSTYEEAMAISKQHLESPQAGDFWHEMLVPILVVLEVMDDALVICDKKKSVGPDHYTFDLDQAKALTLDEFRKRLCYQSMPGQPHCLVSTHKHYQEFVRGWHDEYRDKVLPIIMQAKDQDKYVQVINAPDIMEWMEGRRVLYASLDTLDGQLLRFYVTLSEEKIKYDVEVGDEVVYAGDNINTAVATFNQHHGELDHNEE